MLPKIGVFYAYPLDAEDNKWIEAKEGITELKTQLEKDPKRIWSFGVGEKYNSPEYKNAFLEAVDSHPEFKEFHGSLRDRHGKKVDIEELKIESVMQEAEKIGKTLASPALFYNTKQDAANNKNWKKADNIEELVKKLKEDNTRVFSYGLSDKKYPDNSSTYRPMLAKLFARDADKGLTPFRNNFTDRTGKDIKEKEFLVVHEIDTRIKKSGITR